MYVHLGHFGARCRGRALECAEIKCRKQVFNAATVACVRGVRVPKEVDRRRWKADAIAHLMGKE